MTPLGTHSGYFSMSNSQPISAAVDSAVDAYATKLLREKSPPEACIDENLGPYVTSMIRCSELSERVEDIPDFDSLMELLEEHCTLNSADALIVLSTIAKAVRTGDIEKTSYESLLMEGAHFLSSELGSFRVNPQASDDYQSALPVAIENFSDYHPDKLIPIDLMGLIDDPSTPVERKTASKFDFVEPVPEAFPPLGTSAPTSGPLKKSGKPPRNPSKEDGKDLAATLFHSRPRQHNVEEFYPRARQLSIDADEGYSSTSPNHPSDDNGYQATEGYDYFQQQQLDSAVDMLLSMYSDLSPEAAQQAAFLGCLDVSVAQYVIDGAMSAPPVCRHMMSDGCYRSDCQFSHDVDGHTCLFWLRGRCGKGSLCKFRHGFSDKLLVGMNSEATWVEEPTPAQSRSNPVGIATKNLLSHNAMGVPAPMARSWASGGLSPEGHSLQSWEPLDSGMSSFSLDEKHSKDGFSFASIASKGYKNDSFTTKVATTQNSNLTASKSKSVKIPQDLWSHHLNRNAAAFRIQDPMERYKEVAKSVSRCDVIDLHFQSIKTFPTVLSSVLLPKLREHREVWVITGSGHHVARDSHQKGGGALEAAVIAWLEEEGFTFVRGRDRNGHCGAFLIKNR
jgi:hypothetical protein